MSRPSRPIMKTIFQNQFHCFNRLPAYISLLFAVSSSGNPLFLLPLTDVLLPIESYFLRTVFVSFTSSDLREQVTLTDSTHPDNAFIDDTNQRYKLADPPPTDTPASPILRRPILPLFLTLLTFCTVERKKYRTRSTSRLSP